MEELKTLKRRILEISYKNKLSHLGSYFSCLPVVNEIYNEKEKDDIFILSCGHASLAQYVLLEKFGGISADELFQKHGGHPHRDVDNGIHCSTGSLGMGITVAVGKALANKNRTVYCLISDGECAEGSVWEALKFIHENNIQNIKIYVSINGYAAYAAVDEKYLETRLKSFLPGVNIRNTKVNEFSFLCGLNAHYHVMSESDYKTALAELNESTI
jgi:transketolase